MRRRRVLCAAAAGFLPLAGCASGGGSDPPDTSSSPDGTATGGTPTRTTSAEPTTRTPLPTPDYPANSGDLETFDPSSTAERVRVGSREGVTDPENDGPHDLRIWNAASDSRRFDLGLIDFLSESEVLDESYEVSADAELIVTLLEPSVYVVDLRVSEVDARHRLSVPRSLFDCNPSETRIGVFEGGDVRSLVVSGIVLCSTEKPVD